MKTMKMINLLQHNIKMLDENLQIRQEIPSEGLAWVEQRYLIKDNVAGVPVLDVEYGNISGLPEPQDGVVYIVNGLVAAVAAARGRNDVYSVHVQKNNKKIIGVKSLVLPQKLIF